MHKFAISLVSSPRGHGHFGHCIRGALLFGSTGIGHHFASISRADLSRSLEIENGLRVHDDHIASCAHHVRDNDSHQANQVLRLGDAILQSGRRDTQTRDATA